jgi:hypothetical protein
MSGASPEGPGSIVARKREGAILTIQGGGGLHPSFQGLAADDRYPPTAAVVPRPVGRHWRVAIDRGRGRTANVAGGSSGPGVVVGVAWGRLRCDRAVVATDRGAEAGRGNVYRVVCDRVLSRVGPCRSFRVAWNGRTSRRSRTRLGLHPHDTGHRAGIDLLGIPKLWRA